MDLEPPAPPEGLLVIPLDLGIEVSWQRSTEPDLLGYFVYRREAGQGEYERLNAWPLSVPIYVDRTATWGGSYEYVVTAVDRSPQAHESVFSDSVRVLYVR
jgi:fibronectin type 3 domain-containing protein